MNFKLLAVALLTLACLPSQAAAGAGCSRTLQVPVAPIGLAVMLQGTEVTGIYPDLLRASLTGKPGCSVEFPVVPRARQEMLFENGQADLLLPARRSPRRDEHGVFVPMIKSRAVIVSLLPRATLVGTRPVEPSRSPLPSLAALLAHKTLRVVVVRGYDYGDSYQAALKTLTTQGRLQQVTDPVSLARTLDAHLADVAILTPTILTGALRGEPRYAGILARLRYEPVDELGWGESGIYVSRKPTLPAADRQLLIEQLERVARNGAAWKAFQHYYPEDSLSQTVQPR